MVRRIISAILSVILIATSIYSIFFIPKNHEYIDLAYGTHERNVLDLYIPKRNDGEVGLILFIHGGGFTSGDKKGYREQIQELADDGYVTAAMNYRYLAENIRAEDMLDDIDLALKSIKKKGEEHGVDINKVVLRGYSAGGHLSMLFGYSRIETAEIKPVAVISDAGGPMDCFDKNFYLNSAWKDTEGLVNIMSMLSGKNFTFDTIDSAKEELLKVSPISYVNEATVPTLMNYAMKDELIPFEQAQRLHNKLLENGVKCDFVIYPNSGHGLEGDKDNRKKSEKLFEEYCKTYLK